MLLFRYQHTSEPLTSLRSGSDGISGSEPERRYIYDTDNYGRLDSAGTNVAVSHDASNSVQ